jgi:uncharacterized protein (DUF58 family)
MADQTARATITPATADARPDHDRFDERFLRKLEYLAVVTRRALPGQIRAERRTRRVGAGIEFADHRDYSAGDDLRYLDWNLYGRMERLLVRLFEEDEDLSIHVLFDTSASMGIGTPPKLDVAMQIGAALAYVGLANLDRVALVPLTDVHPAAGGGAATAAAGVRHMTVGDGLPLARGKASILPMLRFLRGVRPAGRTALAPAVGDFLRRHRGRRPGLVVLLSDFYDPAGYRLALDRLRYARFETIVIQVSAPEEARPVLRGDLTIRDVETGEERELTVSPAALEEYRRRHGALLRGLEGFCRERALPCFPIVSDVPFDEVVLRVFRAGGLLR